MTIFVDSKYCEFILADLHLFSDDVISDKDQLFLLLPNLALYLLKFSLPILLEYSVRYSIE